MAKKRHKRGRPKTGSARAEIAKAITILHNAKKKIHIKSK